MTPDELEKERKRVFEGLPEAIRVFASEKKSGGDADYESILLRMVKMKQLNASLAEQLQKSRERNAGEKEKTDQLKLKSANLEYKNLHLIKDIETCKALVTPHLVSLQNEMGGVALAAKDDAKIDELPSLHEAAMKAMDDESAARNQDEEKYKELEKKYEGEFRRYDRKRKFLEQDIPTKLDTVKEIFTEMSENFERYHAAHDKEMANEAKEEEEGDSEEEGDGDDDDDEEEEDGAKKEEDDAQEPEGRAGRSKSVASMAEAEAES